jgi:hypothetical protein
MRLTAGLLAALLTGTAGAAEPAKRPATPPEDKPGVTERPAPSALDAMNPKTAAALRAVLAYCEQARAAPDRNTPELAAAEALAVKQVAQLKGEAALLFGKVIRLNIDSRDGALRTGGVPGLEIGTWMTGLVTDPYDSQARGGSRAHRAMLELRQGDIIGFTAKPLGIIAQDKVCRLIVRFEAIERVQ